MGLVDSAENGGTEDSNVKGRDWDGWRILIMRGGG